jgi:pilus assembly protein CpaD
MRRVTLLVLLQLAACSPAVTDWQPVEASKTLKVDYVRLDHTVHFNPRAGTADRAELSQLNGFLDSAEAQPGDHILLKASGPLADARRAPIEAMLARRGLKTMRVEAPDAPDDGVRIEVGRYVVTPPSCPNWSKPPIYDPQNTVSSNFGCATQVNFGLMVAEPRDLLVGRTPGPVDADPALLPMQRYRAGEVPPLAKEGPAIRPSVVINNGGGGGGQ